MKETELASLQDEQIVCKDCGEEFTWTKGEQAFYRDKGFSPPRRCQSCRAYLKRKIKESEERRGRGEVRDG